MNNTDWHRMWAVFDAALDHPDDEARRRYIGEACAGDSDMAGEVLTLLQAHGADSLLDSTAATPSESLERRIGPYAIVEEVGRGGMGVVFKARDKRLDRLVAIKMLTPGLNADETAKSRFIAEARAAAGLEHPNIATIYDIGEATDGRLYIAMAFYEGETLSDRLERGALEIDEAVGIARHVAAGLIRAHERHIVHRDIKPANILLVEGGGVKILDFGIAKIANLALTQSGATIGTVAYMSPEQARGGEVDHRSDIWSLGVVLYEMLAARRAFDGVYQDAVIYAILHEQPAPLRELRKEVPGSLSGIVDRALQRDPADRFESAEALLNALTHLDGRAAASVPSRLPSAIPERVRATVVVSQLHGYMQLMECIVPQELEAVNTRIRNDVEELVRTFDGRVHQCEGDSIITLFGVPETHEDDFVRGVRAARGIHTLLKTIGDELEARAACRLSPASGVDTGVLVVQSQQDELSVTGSALNVATQLSLHAESGEILISPDCERLVRPFFEMEPGHATRIKGSSAAVTPFRLGAETGLETRLEAAEKAGLTTYTGREAELEQLEEAYRLALTGNGQFVTVVGDAGLGKSRLLHEFVRILDKEAALLKGRCQTYGEKVAYLPFIDLLRQSFGLTNDLTPMEMRSIIAERIAAIDPGLNVFIPLYLRVLSLSDDDGPIPEHLQGEDLRIALVEALAGVITLSAKLQPTVLLMEDWHWADDASEDVLMQVAEIAASYPLLVVVTYRPDRRTTFSRFAHHTSISLKPLDESASRAVIASAFGADDVSGDLAAQLHTRTGGNPFFLEEISRALLDEGLVRVVNGAANPTKPLETIELPDTVQAVIRSRLHRLEYRVRKTVRIAAVIGREFPRRVLSEIIPESDDLRYALERLRELGLIQQTQVVPEARYRFNHVLTQDVAYDSLLQHQRKALHQEVGAAIERLYADRRDEYLDLLVHHFATAEDYHRAATYGKLASTRAMRMSHFTDANALLTEIRAWLEKLPEDAWSREMLVGVLFDHERVCDNTGDRAEQHRIINELLELLSSGESASRLAEARRRQGDLYVLLRNLTEAEASLTSAMEGAMTAGDAEVERRTLRSIGFLRWHQGRTHEAVAINEQLLTLHRQSGDDKAVIGDLVNLCNLMRDLHRLDDALDCLQQARDVVERLDNPSMEAYLYHGLGNIHQMMGNDDEALACLEQARTIAGELRVPLQLPYSLMSIAHIALKQGDIERSIATYKEAIELGRRSRYGDGLARSLLVFGNILLSLERYDEAMEYLLEAAEWFLKLEDAQSEAEVLAKIAAIHERRRHVDEAEAAWHRIAELLDVLGVPTEIKTLEAFARLARLRGDDTEALAHYLDAIELAERAGATDTEARLRNSAGILEWQKGRYEEALSHYRRAIELFQLREDDEGIGLMMNSIGLTLKRMGRHPEAEDQIHDAIETHRAKGHTQLEAYALAVLGDIYSDSARYEEAIDAYARSLQLRWDIDDRAGEGWMLHHLARVHAARGENGRALEYVEQALAVATETNDERLTESCISLRKSAGNIPG